MRDMMPISRVRIAPVFAALLVGAMPAQAAELVTYLSIEGMLGPGDAGNYPLDAEFSWISHRFPGNDIAHIWTLAPGSDGGVTLDAAQPARGQITAVRQMYNINSWLVSGADGVQYRALAQELDFSNIRLSWGGVVYDFGFGTTTSGLVPRVAGPEAVQSANGWWRDSVTGKYHLIFRGEGQCDGCVLTVHLVGQMTAVLLGDVAPAGAPDGRLDVADLLRVTRFVEALEVPASADKRAADINGDDALDVADVLALSRMLGN